MKNKPAVLLVGPSLNKVGGITYVTKQILTSQLKNQYQFSYLSIQPNLDNFLAKRIYQLSFFPYSIYILIKNKIDLVHIHTASQTSFWFSSLSWLAAKFLHRKIILHIHGGRFEEFYSKSNFKQLIRYLLNNSSKVVVLSNYWSAYFKEKFNLGKNLEILSNSINVVLYQAYPKKKNKKIQLLFVGGDWEHKGVFDILNAISQIPKIYQNKIHLNIVGLGDSEKAGELVNEKDLKENVSFLGLVKGQGLRRLYRDSTIFLLPSYAEGLPIAILEAMASGLPIISTKVGAIPEIIRQGVNGFLIVPGDIKDLKEKILELVSDPILRRKMSFNNIKDVKEFYDQKLFEKRLNDIYVSVLK